MTTMPPLPRPPAPPAIHGARVLLGAGALLLALAACGDPAPRGVVGRWGLDLEATWGESRALWVQQKEAELGQAREKLKVLETLPPEGRAAARELALKGVAPELHALLDALVAGDVERRDAVLKELFVRGVGAMQIQFELAADGTSTNSLSLGSEREEGTGVWREADGRVLVTPKTKNGKPVTGGAAAEFALTVRGDALLSKSGERDPVLVFRRR